MSWLAIWLILEFIGVGTAPDVCEPHAFKNVYLQMMINQTFIFRRKFYKRFAQHSSF